MRRSGLDRVLGAAVGVCLAAGVAAEASAQPRDADCRAEIAAHCAAVLPGQGRVAGCLQERYWQLSAACQAHAKTVAGALKETLQACHDDLLLHCSRAEVAGGRGARCLAGRRGLAADCSRVIRLLQPR
jgi:hypothetical protein